MHGFTSDGIGQSPLYKHGSEGFRGLSSRIQGMRMAYCDLEIGIVGAGIGHLRITRIKRYEPVPDQVIAAESVSVILPFTPAGSANAGLQIYQRRRRAVLLPLDRTVGERGGCSLPTRFRRAACSGSCTYVLISVRIRWGRYDNIACNISRTSVPMWNGRVLGRDLFHHLIEPALGIESRKGQRASRNRRSEINNYHACKDPNENERNDNLDESKSIIQTESFRFHGMYPVPEVIVMLCVELPWVRVIVTLPAPGLPQELKVTVEAELLKVTPDASV